MQKPLILATLVLSLLAPPAEAVFSINQVTVSSGDALNLFPSLSADGTLLVFTSDADLVPGENQDGNREVFLKRRPGALQQITHTLDAFASRARVTASGSHVVFSMQADLTGENPQLAAQLFRFNLSQGTFEQLTNVPSGFFVGSPSPSADGSHIAFTSNADIIPGGNPSGDGELFLWKNGVIQQITQSTVPVNRPWLSGDGNRIVFDSRGDFTGENADANNEIFLYEVSSASMTQVTITDGGGGSAGPIINTDGNWVAIESNRDLVPGANGSASDQIFLYEVATGAFTQITTGVGFGSINPGISGSGNRIAFASSRDLVPGSNTDLSAEVFLYDRLSGELEQVTNTIGSDVFSFPSLDRFGTTVAFDFDRDITGENADESWEIFVARRSGGCTAGAETLCLAGERFQIEVEWERPSGETGAGTAVKLTSDTGYFWFFNSANVEMIIKVLNGCANNSNYWVFAGGLTNVGVEITVTDTRNGIEKVYENPLREPFQPIQDTSAFPTCP